MKYAYHSSVLYQSGRRVHILAGSCSPIMSMCFLEGSLEPAIGIRDKNEELRKERSSTVQNAFCESRQDKKCYRDRRVLFLPLVRVQKRKLLAFLAFVPNLCRPVTKKSGKIQAKRKVVHHTNYSTHNIPTRAAVAFARRYSTKAKPSVLERGLRNQPNYFITLGTGTTDPE